MDKYEYKVRADEIKSLIASGEYAEAVKIADTIDWRRVKSAMMLCTISDLYKINRRYEDSRDILLLAYERHTGGRLIVYSLCELSIKLEEYVQAFEYYKEYVQLAPKDSGRYILLYKLYEAQEVSLEERIAVLEELKKKDYRERWAYELAYLYHRIGLESKCVEECDEIFLWFGEGKYVLKALELKKLHQPLNEQQQEKYEQMKRSGNAIEAEIVTEGKAIKEEAGVETEDEDDDEFSLQQNILTDPTQELPTKEIDEIQVKTVDVSQYNTLNLQKELAESMKEFLDKHPTEQMPVEQVAGEPGQAGNYGTVPKQEAVSAEIPKRKNLTEEPKKNTSSMTTDMTAETTSKAASGMTAKLSAEMMPEKTVEDQEKEAEEAESKGAALQSKVHPVHQETDEMQLISEDMLNPTAKAEAVSEEVFFGNTAEVNIEDVVSELVRQDAEEAKALIYRESDDKEELPAPGNSSLQEEKKPEARPVASPDPSVSNTGVIRTFHKPSGYDSMLSQEYDGQLSLVVPEQEKVEKQITGQLSINDVMAEWERMKKENEEKMMADIKERVHRQTDALFADFDESTKSGLLEELEKAMVDAALKESKKSGSAGRPRVVKISDIENASAISSMNQEEPELEEIDLEEVELEETELEEMQPQEAGSEKIQSAEPESEEVQVEEIQKVLKAKGAEEESEIEFGDAGENFDGEQTEADDTEDEEETVQETAAEDNSDSQAKYTAREMTKSEREQFASFIHHKRTRNQIVEVLDNISMASYTGNVIITGEEDLGTINLAKLLLNEVQLSDDNFSGKVAKISGTSMNKKNIAATFSKLSGGAFIIEEAASMKKPAVEALVKELDQEEKELIVILADKKKPMDKFLAKYTILEPIFNLRVDVEALNDQALVKYAKKYALDQEYSIDELGVLALHTRIADMQTSDHEVTLAEIEELVDEAIYYADKKNPKHFFDVLFGKRYDEEDMIVLREKDFMHY